VEGGSGQAGREGHYRVRMRSWRKRRVRQRVGLRRWWSPSIVTYKE
jgi:hypothetical protein